MAGELHHLWLCDFQVSLRLPRFTFLHKAHPSIEVKIPIYAPSILQNCLKTVDFHSQYHLSSPYHLHQLISHPFPWMIVVLHIRVIPSDNARPSLLAAIRAAARAVSVARPLCLWILLKLFSEPPGLVILHVEGAHTLLELLLGPSPVRFEV